MSFLDRVTKAVGDAVDRGRKEVDQFVQIQRINGQIADLEGTIKQCRERIEEATLKIGRMAVEMLRAGKIASPEMQALLDEITRIERGIGEAECQIAGKQAEIEQIRAEASTEKSPEASPDQPQPDDPSPVPTAPTTRACPQCGTQAAGSGSFCSQCGARLA
jgi:chromosome segregation ATPase